VAIRGIRTPFYVVPFEAVLYPSAMIFLFLPFLLPCLSARTCYAKTTWVLKGVVVVAAPRAAIIHANVEATYCYQSFSLYKGHLME